MTGIANHYMLKILNRSSLIVIIITWTIFLWSFFLYLSLGRLQPAIENAPNSYLINSTFSRKFKSNSIAIIVRAHENYAHQLMALIWMFESQNYPGDIFILVIPTEYESIEYLSKLLSQNWKDVDAATWRRKGVFIKILNLPRSYYERYCCLLTSLCTDEWRKRKMKENFSERTLRRYCEINSPMHYFLTDIAVDAVLHICNECAGLVITNADNFYSPTYLAKTAHMLSSFRPFIFSSSEPQYDIILTDMVHLGQPVTTEASLGKMDLGGVLLSVPLIHSSKIRFLTSLPIPTEPQHYHDADFHFVKKLLEYGGKHIVVHQTLYTHN